MKKITVFVLMLILSLTALFGCDLFFGTGEEVKDGTEKIKVVYPEGADYGDAAVKLSEILSSELDCNVSFGIDSHELEETEIILGNTSRSLSEIAYSRLNRVDKEKDGNVAYLVYSDGSSVVIAFEEDKYGDSAALSVAIDRFFNECVKGKDSLVLNSGDLLKGDVDPVEHQLLIDLELQSVAISNAVRKIGDETLRENLRLAITEFYGLMTGGTITWLANLYDPQIGGFYYSNSARDTEGFLPDIESTGQALTYIGCCGILDSIGGKSGLSPELKAAIGRFVKPLQDPNGYFYHPQWGKKLTDTMVERRARDLSWAMSCLNFAGLKPTYDTPTGAKGDGMLIDGTRVDSVGNVIASSFCHLYAPIKRGSVASMVSAAVLASDAYVSPALLNEHTFREYLEKGDIRNNGYGFGSELSSQLSEILYRDKQLAEEGADYSLMEILIEYLNENQNPENGVWYWVDKSNPNYSYYAGVNGLLKIGGIYTAAGEEMPNAIAASKTAIEAIYSDEDPEGIVDIYNAWFAVENTIKNINSCAENKEIGEANVKELRATLLADADNSIRATMQKLALFKKTDGSFSYLQDSSAPWSSGMSVAVKWTDEGDINATVIGGLDTADRMFSVLGLSVPEFYGRGGLYQFLDIIENASPVIKDPKPEAEPIDFDYENIGDIPSELTVTVGANGKTEVIADPRGEGNVLYIESNPESNDTVIIPTQSSSIGESCFVFETDMCAVSAAAGYAVQLSLSEAYMLCLRFDKNGVNFFDSSSSSVNKIDVDFCYSVPFGQWFKLRVEYYAGEHDDVRIKVYVDGQVIAVSNNYFDYYGKKITEGEGIPSNAIGSVKFFAMRSSQFVVMMDNILTDKTKTAYEPYIDADNQPTVNVDSPDREELIYDFDNDLELPKDFIIQNGKDNIDLTDYADGKAMSFGGTPFSIGVPINVRTSTAKCSVFEAKLVFTADTVGNLIDIAFCENSYSEQRITGFKIYLADVDGVKKLVLHESPTGSKGAEISGVEMPIGEEYTLRIEYYAEQKAIIVYINEKMIGLSSAVVGGSEKFTVGKIKISADGDRDFKLLVDELRCEKIEKNFEEATKPSVDRIIHDFEENSATATLTGSATLTSDGTNGVVTLGISTGSVSIPLNKRSDVFSAVVFSQSIFIPKNAPSSQNSRIALTDAEGNAVLVYQFKVSDGRVNVHEVTESCVYETPIASFDLGKYVTLSLEYFSNNETAMLYIDGELSAISNVIYDGESYSKELVGATVSHISGAMIKIDDMFLECVNKLFLLGKIDSENKEDGAEIITFEHSSGGNLPSSVSVSLNSGGASVRIKELIERDKALVLLTNSGGADTVSIKSSNTSGASEAMVLSTRIRMDIAGNLYLFFYSDSGKQLHRININVDSLSAGGGVRIDDNSGLGESYGYGTLGNPLSGKTVGEWFDLKIEFVNYDDGNMEARIFVDGKYFATSKEAAWAKNKALDISRIDMTTSGGSTGSFAIGEISLSAGSLTDISD